MSPVVVGFIGIGVLLLIFMIGVPIAFGMALVGFVGFAVLTRPAAALNILALDIFTQLGSYPLSVIPMFILMGTFAFASGISSSLYDIAYKWFGHLRGGLNIATIFACAAFGAVCGSATATAATMGKVALPEMKKYGYSDMLATGTVAAGGVLGILIPPSTVFLVYGLLTENSIGKLFISGVLPGIMLAVLFALVVVAWCARNPSLGPPGPRSSWGDRLRSLTGVADTAILFFGTMGGLFAGYFTPNQAGAIGAAGALVIGLARRKLTWKGFAGAAKEGLQISCMVLFIIAGAIVFGKFMARANISMALGNYIDTLSVPAFAVMLVIIFFYFIGGCVMDSLALTVLTIPIFYPIVLKLGYDPIWFGVIIVLVNGMGLVTPPVGNNVFVIKGIAQGVRLETIFAGVWPFVGAMLVCSILLMLFPQIATILPSFITY